MSQTNGSVLVVDDSITVRKVIERTLAGRGWTVSSAQSAADALDQLTRHTPDVVISDVVMPDKSGYEIAEFIRRHPTLSGTPVILISGVITPAVRERAVQAGATDVMAKPFSPEELTAKIETLMKMRATAPAAPAAARPAAPPARVTDASPARPASTPSEGARSVKAWVDDVMQMPGVQLVVIVDRDGLLLEVGGARAQDVDEALPAALAACLAEASRGIGRTLSQGALDGMILEYDKGVLLARYVGEGAILGVLLHDPAFLGKLRYTVKRGIGALEANLR